MTDEINNTGNAADTGNEPWRRWTVKPVLEAMFADPPESGVGRRIAYCRGQLDNLSLDALARYTKFFDDEGVSRASLYRYETGQALPGARELRILSKALWVPVGRLLLGNIETDTKEDNAGRDLLVALDRYAARKWGASGAQLNEMLSGISR
jgi:transcriptional regulator with XRE-family HTH domain